MVVNAGAVLPSVALLLHEQLRVVDAVEGGTVFFVVVFQWFKQPDQAIPHSCFICSSCSSLLFVVCCQG